MRSPPAPAPAVDAAPHSGHIRLGAQLPAGLDQGAILQHVRIGDGQRFECSLQRRQGAIEGAFRALDDPDPLAVRRGNRTFEMRVGGGAQKAAEALMHRSSQFQLKKRYTMY
jgi:hypothetical protein